MNVKKVSNLSIFLALSIVLSIIESFIIITNVIPGVKIGIANIVILMVLYIYGSKDAVVISILRVFIVGLLRTGIFSINFFFSLSGAIISIISMSSLKKITKLSMVGISIVGATAHSIGQLLFATFFVKSVAILLYAPAIIIISVISGIITGLISKYLMKYIEKEIV